MPARTRTSPDRFSPSPPFWTILSHLFCFDSIHLLTPGSLNVRNPLGLYEVVLKTEAVLSVVRRIVRATSLIKFFKTSSSVSPHLLECLILSTTSSSVFQTLVLLSCRRTSLITLLASPHHSISQSLGSVALDLFLKGDTAQGVRNPKNRLCAEDEPW